MQSLDFFRCRIDSMIDLRDPLAVLARRLPWEQIEEALAPKFKRKERAGQCVEGHDWVRIHPPSPKCNHSATGLSL
jgi:IS5 family transposase